jgi:hypothetical protein
LRRGQGNTGTLHCFIIRQRPNHAFSLSNIWCQRAGENMLKGEMDFRAKSASETAFGCAPRVFL